MQLSLDSNKSHLPGKLQDKPDKPAHTPNGQSVPLPDADTVKGQQVQNPFNCPYTPSLVHYWEERELVGQAPTLVDIRAETSGIGQRVLLVDQLVDK